MPSPRRFKSHSLTAIRAHNLVRNLIAWGLIPAARILKCFDCGKKAREYDHPAGYKGRDALMIQPVCSSCHFKRGYRRGELKPRDMKLEKHPGWKGGIALNWKEYMRKYNQEYKLGLRRKGNGKVHGSQK